jgi:hypothetical protein
VENAVIGKAEFEDFLPAAPCRHDLVRDNRARLFDKRDTKTMVQLITDYLARSLIDLMKCICIFARRPADSPPLVCFFNIARQRPRGDVKSVHIKPASRQVLVHSRLRPA